MTTYENSRMPNDLLSVLRLDPSEVPSLPAKTRSALIAFLLRWEYHDEALSCLQQLRATHSHLVSVYDNLARLYLALDQPQRALEMMRRRHALRASNSSRALEARAYLAAGDWPSAQTIAEQLLAEHPQMLLTWSLQAKLRLAAGDPDGAEDAWRQREALRPGTGGTALGLARTWEARGDLDKAILWARTSLARFKRDGRQPSIDLLRLLEALNRATHQQAQANAVAADLDRRHKQELEDLANALELAPPEAGTQPPTPTDRIAEDELTARPCQTQSAATPAGVIAGAVELAPAERADLDETLHRHFPYDAFRPGQADVIATILRGENALAVMPTGAGKSLCYQLAAQLLPGTTLVISPLIALMKDQLDGLPDSVAPMATTLNSTLDGAELSARLVRAAAGGYRLLYAAPERLRQRPFLHALKQAGVSLLVVDEAHCVSLWGHDFRPDYLFIAKAWRELGQPPILAMTATATPRVRDDIQVALNQTRLIATDLHRPNLCLEARRFAKEAEKKRALLALCREIEGSGIVYARSRLKCEELADMLRGNGLSAIHYHAGIQDRAATQDRFMSDQARIVVATIAFGMGVDKADVRFVIHYSPPQALENYYQEAGRAGRDGLPAHCILFYSQGDKALMTRWAHQDALRVEFLRNAYAALQNRLGSDGAGLVNVGDLERDLVADATMVRVAIHFLETAGLLWRGFDLPRTATLRLCRPPDGTDAEFVRFIEAARLLPGQTVTRSLLAVSRDAGLDSCTIEAQVLAWEDAGWLRYHGIGRDILLTLPDPSPDSRQIVAAMLADYHDGKDGRIADMIAYAETRRCRHGYISAYFGGHPIERCQSCDNCLKPSHKTQKPQRTRHPRQPRQPTRSEAQADTIDPLKATILQGVAQLPYPMGRTGLARALQGAGSSSLQSDRFPLFGALAGSTQKHIQGQIAHLEDLGLLEPFRRDGYRVLRLTREGRSWLDRQLQERTNEMPPPVQSPRRTAQNTGTEPPTQYDEELYDRLRAWQLATAREKGLPPHFVLHDATLKRIAAERPTSLEGLMAIRGIGPKKLEQYGPAVLALVADQEAKTRGS